MEQVVKLICEYPKRPLFIAIEGHSAAGKSTLANRIAETMDEVTIIPTDDFYRVMPEAERFELSIQEGYERYYDWQRLKGVLEPLAKGQPSHYQLYDWLANKLGETIHLVPKGITVVEGCYSMRPELLPLYDLTFYVEAPKDVRSKRQHQRADANEIWWNKWDAAETYHISKNVPQKKADMIIYGDEVMA